MTEGESLGVHDSAPNRNGVAAMPPMFTDGVRISRPIPPGHYGAFTAPNGATLLLELGHIRDVRAAGKGSCIRLHAGGSVEVQESEPVVRAQLAGWAATLSPESAA
jgi:hypothetical protein